jgi:hypothetical protein
VGRAQPCTEANTEQVQAEAHMPVSCPLHLNAHSDSTAVQGAEAGHCPVTLSSPTIKQKCRDQCTSSPDAVLAASPVVGFLQSGSSLRPQRALQMEATRLPSSTSVGDAAAAGVIANLPNLDTDAPSAEDLPVVLNPTACSMDSLFSQLLPSSSFQGVSGCVSDSDVVLDRGSMPTSEPPDIAWQLPCGPGPQACVSALHERTETVLSSCSPGLAEQQQWQQQQQLGHRFGCQFQQVNSNMPDELSRCVSAQGASYLPHTQPCSEAQQVQHMQQHGGQGLQRIQRVAPPSHTLHAQHNLLQQHARVMQDAQPLRPLLPTPSHAPHQQLSKEQNMLDVGPTQDVPEGLRGPHHGPCFYGLLPVQLTPEQQYAWALRQQATLRASHRDATADCALLERPTPMHMMATDAFHACPTQQYAHVLSRQHESSSANAAECQGFKFKGSTSPNTAVDVAPVWQRLPFALQPAVLSGAASCELPCMPPSMGTCLQGSTTYSSKLSAHSSWYPRMLPTMGFHFIFLLKW